MEVNRTKVLAPFSFYIKLFGTLLKTFQNIGLIDGKKLSDLAR